MDFIFSPLNHNIYRFSRANKYGSLSRLTDSEDQKKILKRKLFPEEFNSNDNFNDLENFLLEPFKLPPLKYGSRFGSENEKGIFYASCDIITALYESVYYLFVFIKDSNMPLKPYFVTYNSFSVGLKTSNNLDLTVSEWKNLKYKISDPSSWQYSQDIGKKAREADFDSISYYSSRKDSGVNIAVLKDGVFLNKKPQDFIYWEGYINNDYITFQSSPSQVRVFKKSDFMIEGNFPLPS